MKNLLENFKQSNFEFLNLDENNETALVATRNDGISLIPDANTEFFRDPASETVMSNAIFMYIHTTGDFVARSRVDQDFIYDHDVAGMMVRHNDETWAQIGFEKTDFGTHALVSTVTRDGFSDEANGANYPWNSVWLQLARKGHTFSMHYSPDCSSWHLVRYFTLGRQVEDIQVGLVAQSPHGMGDATMNFYNFEFEKFSVRNIREGL